MSGHNWLWETKLKNGVHAIYTEQFQNGFLTLHPNFLNDAKYAISVAGENIDWQAFSSRDNYRAETKFLGHGNEGEVIAIRYFPPGNSIIPEQSIAVKIKLEKPKSYSSSIEKSLTASTLQNLAEVRQLEKYDFHLAERYLAITQYEPTKINNIGILSSPYYSIDLLAMPYYEHVIAQGAKYMKIENSFGIRYELAKIDRYLKAHSSNLRIDLGGNNVLTQEFVQTMRYYFIDYLANVPSTTNVYFTPNPIDVRPSAWKSHKLKREG